MFLLLLTSIPLLSAAQGGYKCLLEEGKSWHESADFGALRLDVDLFLSGDTVIDGESYHKLYESTIVLHPGIDGESLEAASPKLRVPIREEGQKVFIYTYGKHLLYDFSMQPGDSLMIGTNEWVKVNAIDTVAVGDALYRRFQLSHVQDNATARGQQWPESESRQETEETFWVEGIGSDKGLTSLFAWYGEAAAYASKSRFDSCQMNGECIFIADDFVATAYRPDNMASLHPFVKEGKQWKEYMETPKARWEFTYTIAGDTVIGGESYHKLYYGHNIYDILTDPGTPKEIYVTEEPVYYAGLQEHDGRVYIHQNDRKSLLYDFTLNVGDVAFEDNTYIQRVTKVDTIAVGGLFLRRMWLTENWKGGNQAEDESGCWVEGIGSSRGLICPHGWFDEGSLHFLTECTENGQQVFTYNDFTAPAYKPDDIPFSSVKDMRNKDSYLNYGVYDLQGRRVSPSTSHPSPLKKGIYIENGRKRVVR